MSSFVAFLDLVGMRDLATQRAGAEEFIRILNLFHTHLCSNIHVLLDDSAESESESDRVYFFSDCAFIESGNSRRLFTFIRRVRYDLMAQGVYFKAAVIQGTLQARGVRDLFKGEPELVPLYGARISGNYFGSAAAEAYREQDRLKGIGVTIAKSVAEPILAKKGTTREPEIVTSCFVAPPPARGLVLFYDLSFPRADRTESAFENLVSSAIDANGRSRSFARYYVSPIVSWIQSAALEFDAPDSELPIDPGHRFVLSGRLERLLAGVTGIEVPYFAMVAKVFSAPVDSSAPNNRLNSVRHQLAKQHRLRKKMSAIPVDLLSIDARRSFHKVVSKV